jgi:hypothetical protein
MDSEGMRPPELEPEVSENGEPIPLEPGAGVLEMHPNGYGFLRVAENNYQRERTDPFVPATMIERYKLREGVFMKALVQPGRRQQGPRVREIQEVEGMPPDNYTNVKTFDQLTPINPETWLRLETGQQPLTTRVMDLLTPLGKGQRALIVAPPRTGKTVMLQQVSQAISTNHPELNLVMLLIDERPEEVTDMRRSVKGEVFASSLDCDVESHVRLSQLVIERCKRMAEAGKDVFLLMDSITRSADGPQAHGTARQHAGDLGGRVRAAADCGVREGHRTRPQFVRLHDVDGGGWHQGGRERRRDGRIGLGCDRAGARRPDGLPREEPACDRASPAWSRSQSAQLLFRRPRPKARRRRARGADPRDHRVACAATSPARVVEHGVSAACGRQVVQWWFAGVTDCFAPVAQVDRAWDF